ncbi:hypothetical protein [Paenibacillus sambharensis]|uniref:hypothetical protein n=1 Tax=Paenibacillus sambharensis TaxID=1803190 RepID=UPI0015E8C343|nr:hypothetical protein [Paenibacillus sambharensis]
MFDSTDAFDMLDVFDIWGTYNPNHQPRLPQVSHTDPHSEAPANHGGTGRASQTHPME